MKNNHENNQDNVEAKQLPSQMYARVVKSVHVETEHPK